MSIAQSDPDTLGRRLARIAATIGGLRQEQELLSEAIKRSSCSHSPLGSHHQTCDHCYAHWRSDRIDDSIEHQLSQVSMHGI